MTKIKYFSEITLFFFASIILILIVVHQALGRGWFFISLLASSLFFFFLIRSLRHPLFPRWRHHVWSGQDPWGLGTMLARLSEQSFADFDQSVSFVELECEAPLAAAEALRGRPARMYFSSGLLAQVSERELEVLTKYLWSSLQLQQEWKFSVARSFQLALLEALRWIGAASADQLGIRDSSLKHWFSGASFLHRSWIQSWDKVALLNLDQDRLLLGRLLWKMEGHRHVHLTQVPKAESYFCAFPVGSKSPAVHPRIELRLQRLIGYYPP